MSAGPPEKRLLLLVAEYDYFLSHRLALATDAVQAGYRVRVVTRVPAARKPVCAQGIDIIHYPIRRSLKNPISDLALLRFLIRMCRSFQPHIVHNVSFKLAVIGSLAARAATVAGVVNAYTGLGYVFHSQSFSSRCLRSILNPLLGWISCQRGCWSIFQNDADLEIFRRRGLIAGDRVTVIRGSGVDICEFTPAPEPPGDTVVMFVGRILRDKGIAEFVHAAERLRGAGIRARFVAVGEPDPESPSSVDASTLSRWRASSCVEWWGARTDMARVYAQAAMVCLPSYYEGVPKVLLEAAACARPIVATNIPGIADLVGRDECGILVAPRDVSSLAAAIEKLILNKDLRATLGARGRQIVEQRFAARLINSQILNVYERIFASTAC